MYLNYFKIKINFKLTMNQMLLFQKLLINYVYLPSNGNTKFSQEFCYSVACMTVFNTINKGFHYRITYFFNAI